MGTVVAVVVLRCVASAMRLGVIDRVCVVAEAARERVRAKRMRRRTVDVGAEPSAMDGYATSRRASGYVAVTATAGRISGGCAAINVSPNACS